MASRASAARKHAMAGSAEAEICQRPGRLAVEVSDDGAGGARPEGGSGLRGLPTGWRRWAGCCGWTARRVLTDAGLDVAGTAGDAEQLLSQVATARPDVVLTDIRMPPAQTTEGLQAALEIRRRWPGTAVIADIAQFTGAIRRVAAGESAPRGVSLWRARQNCIGVA